MEKIYKYIEEHATAQSEALSWVEKQTHIRTNHARMLSGAVQGQLMRMLVQMTGAKRILELGTFTGYSAICLAGALPEDGHLDTLELNDELEDLILEGFERAGVSSRISLHIGDCKETLARLRSEYGIPPVHCDSPAGRCDSQPELSGKLYDIVYMDANKREYCEYYDLVFDMVRPGGLILADNVLWDGKVCQDPLPQDRQTLSIARFNDMVAADPRVESVILPLRDGLNIIRKAHRGATVIVNSRKGAFEVTPVDEENDDESWLTAEVKAQIDEAIKQVERGEVYRMNTDETLTEFLDRLDKEDPLHV